MPRELWNETTYNISCVHGNEKEYPTAEIYLTVGGHTYLMSVALVPSLPYPVVLGNDVPTLLDLIQARSEHQGPHVQRVRMHKKVAYTLFHVNDQMYQERNERGNVRCLTQIPGLSYALFYSY